MNAEVRRQILAELKAARGIAGIAEGAGRRDLTAEERRKIENHLRIAEGLKARDASAAEVTGQLNGLAEGIGLTVDDPGHGYAPARGTKTGPGWGAKAIAQHSDQFGRFKALAPSGTIMVNVPAPAPIPLASPATDIRQLIPTEPSAGVFAYLRQTSRVNNAAVVPAGGLKPTSTYGLVRVQGQVVTVAHLSEGINRADLSDSALLGAFLDGELYEGLRSALTGQIVNGDGIGENFDGLLNVDGTTPVGFVPGLTDGLGVVATARRAITTLDITGSKVDGFLLHPTDWERAEMSATTTGELVLADAGARVPIDAAAQRLFGRPVVTSVAVPQGTGIAAEFAASTRLHVREEAVIDYSENTFRPDALGAGIGASDFARNLVAFRCEMRAGLAIMRPAGIAVLDLTA